MFTSTGHALTLYARLLEWLIGKAKDDPEFIKKRDELSQEGAADRKVHEEKNNKKQDKKQGKLNFKRKKSKDSDADSD